MLRGVNGERMNRLLSKLAEDAGIDCRHIEKHVDDYFDKHLEDFANRLILECCEFVENHEDGNSCVASDIAEHFGLIYKGE